jgi:LysR family transcriptional regulator, hypochlorite-specific transcription factor HypT
MELKWLEDFLMLAETRSFSRAAVARNVKQPALSRRIRALEDWVGVDLVDRTCIPLRLTAAGEVFREQAVNIVVQARYARAITRTKAPPPWEEKLCS